MVGNAGISGTGGIAANDFDRRQTNRKAANKIWLCVFFITRSPSLGHISLSCSLAPQGIFIDEQDILQN
jgi:hypothetical protein